MFSHIFAIGNYASNSGLDAAWMHADWFDSPCLLRQVLECMKRALSTLEPTVIAIGIMLLKEIVDDNKDDLSAFDEQLSNLLGTGRSALDSHDTT